MAQKFDAYRFAHRAGRDSRLQVEGRIHLTTVETDDDVADGEAGPLRRLAFQNLMYVGAAGRFEPQADNLVTVELFNAHPQVGRFTWP